MFPLTKYDTIVPNQEKNEIRFHVILILMYMLIRGTKLVLIDQEMYELWAPENEGRMDVDVKNMEIIMLHKPVTVLLLLFIFFIHMTKYANCSICVYVAHNH